MLSKRGGLSQYFYIQVPQSAECHHCTINSPFACGYAVLDVENLHSYPVKPTEVGLVPASCETKPVWFLDLKLVASKTTMMHMMKVTFALGKLSRSGVLVPTYYYFKWACNGSKNELFIEKFYNKFKTQEKNAKIRRIRRIYKLDCKKLRRTNSSSNNP